MSIFESIRKNSSTSAVVACIILAVAVFFIFRQVSGSATARFTQPKWMYDLITKQLVIAEADTYAPHDSGSGSFDYGERGAAGALVDVMVYTCGDPTDVEEGMTVEQLASVDAWILYLHRGVDNSPAEGAGGLSGSTEARLVSNVEGTEWFTMLSTQGKIIQDEHYKACGDGSLPLRTRP